MQEKRLEKILIKFNDPEYQKKRAVCDIALSSGLPLVIEWISKEQIVIRKNKVIPHAGVEFEWMIYKSVT